MDPAVSLAKAISNWESSIAFMQRHAASADALVGANPGFAKTPLNYSQMIQNAQRWLDYARQAQASGNANTVRVAIETSSNAWRGAVDPGTLAASRQAVTQIVPQLAQQGSTLPAVVSAVESSAPAVASAVESSAPALLQTAEDNAPRVLPLAGPAVYAAKEMVAPSRGWLGLVKKAGVIVAALTLPLLLGGAWVASKMSGGSTHASAPAPTVVEPSVPTTVEEPTNPSVPDSTPTSPSVSVPAVPQTPTTLPFFSVPETATTLPFFSVPNQEPLPLPLPQPQPEPQPEPAPAPVPPPNPARPSGGGTALRIKVVSVSSCSDQGLSSPDYNHHVTIDGVAIPFARGDYVGRTTRSAGPHTVGGAGPVISINIHPTSGSVPNNVRAASVRYVFDAQFANSSSLSDYEVAVRFRAGTGC